MREKKSYGQRQEGKLESFRAVERKQGREGCTGEEQRKPERASGKRGFKRGKEKGFRGEKSKKKRKRGEQLNKEGFWDKEATAKKERELEGEKKLGRATGWAGEKPGKKKKGGLLPREKKESLGEI